MSDDAHAGFDAATSEESFQALLFNQILPTMRRQHRGPIAKFLIWLAGGDAALLRLVPRSEERMFMLLGGTITFTATVAGLLGYTTTGFLLKGGVVWSRATVIGGVFVFFFVLTLDRILVKIPLNPYRFPPKVLAALWNPKSDATWFEILVRDLGKRSFGQGATETLRVLRTALLRIVIAFCTSYLFAQSALFFLFADDIKTVASQVKQDQSGALSESLTADHDKKVAALQKTIDSYDASTDPKVKELQTKVNMLQAAFTAKTADVTTIGLAIADELYGYKRCYVFVSTDAPKNFCTSGQSGPGQPGSNYYTDIGISDTWKGQAATLGSSLSAANSALTSRKNTVAGSVLAVSTVEKDKAEIADLDQKLTVDLKEAAAPVGAIKGILVRKQALDQLERDTNPNVTPITLIADCPGGLSGVLCSAQRLVYVPTPVGPYVAAFSVLFFVIEILPVVVKIAIALRRRRPYDELEAGIEEVWRAKIIEMVDTQLIQAGARLEARASWRKARRSGIGAEFLLADADRAATNEDELLRNLIFGDEFIRRRRLWPRFWRRKPKNNPPESENRD